jgi:FixJ family two-component response regulator
MKQPGQVVYLVDNDLRGREAVSGALEASSMNVIGFRSGGEYLEYNRTDRSSCLILDLHLPDMSGLDLQRRLLEKANPPVIFVSGQCDIPSTVRAMKAGAVEFLTKPVDPEALISAVRVAFAKDLEQRRKTAELDGLQRRFALLTSREREVLPLLVGGMLNKQAAAVLGITEVTVQVHRGQIMKKMEATSFAELVRMAGKLGIPEPDGTSGPLTD